MLAEGEDAGEAAYGVGWTRFPLRSGGRLMATLVVQDPLTPEALASIELLSLAYGAMLEAGRSAGGYLDEIGKTDLALLSADEWTPPF